MTLVFYQHTVIKYYANNDYCIIFFGKNLITSTLIFWWGVGLKRMFSLFGKKAQFLGDC